MNRDRFIQETDEDGLKQAAGSEPIPCYCIDPTCPGWTWVTKQQYEEMRANLNWSFKDLLDFPSKRH